MDRRAGIPVLNKGKLSSEFPAPKTWTGKAFPFACAAAKLIKVFCLIGLPGHDLKMSLYDVSYVPQKQGSSLLPRVLYVCSKVSPSQSHGIRHGSGANF